MKFFDFSENKEKKNWKPLIIFLSAAAIFGIFYGGYLMGKSANAPLSPANADMTLFWKTWQHLGSQFRR